MDNTFQDKIKEHSEDLKKLLDKTIFTHYETIKKIALSITTAYRKNKKIIIFGNGGSYADSLHFAAELERSLTRVRVADKWRTKKYRK